MKLVQQAWRAMPDDEKSRFKYQSRENRDEYDRERREFDSIKQNTAAQEAKDSIIQGVKARAVAK